jgi:hypothetical protein
MDHEENGSGFFCFYNTVLQIAKLARGDWLWKVEPQAHLTTANAEGINIQACQSPKTS